ncbi:MAG TPA: class I SAM-dependent methyltransferase [Bacteroidales bacterium]|nr:class I SAM-dependent methyltransferase [Bacteroidales bacterium]
MDNFNISIKRFDEFASEYAVRFMNIDSYREHFDKFCELIFISQPDILELACGPGNVTRYLKEKFPGAKIIALDLAPRMLELARQTVTGVDFRLMDVRDIKSLNLTFDAIMCSFCLPFLSKTDTQKLISDCSAVLNKNGVLYLSTMEGDESRAGFESTSFTGDSKIYFNYHMQHDLEKALADSGFNVEYIVRQNYIEPKGTILIDIILVAKKI